MVVTATEKVFNHGIGRGLFFPITNGTHGSAVEVKGLTAQSEDPNAESTNIWADMEGVAFFTQQGAVTRSTEITALEYPEAMKTHALGKKKSDLVLLMTLKHIVNSVLSSVNGVTLQVKKSLKLTCIMH